jgi:hypothetical protein
LWTRPDKVPHSGHAAQPPRPGHHEQHVACDNDLLDDRPGQVRQKNAQLNGTWA